MKTLLKTILLISLLGFAQQSKAQTIEVLAGNTLNGAMNGVMLGGATMALQNSTDFDPVRVGLGFGTLYGIGIGVYDVVRTPAGQQFYISGTFNDGTNTSILVLLDTFYGAAAGAIVASSFTLIANEPIVEGLQYGSGVGAWVGFGFGLIDAFALSSRPGSLQANRAIPDRINGLVKIRANDSSFEAGFLAPSYNSFKEIGQNSLELRHTFNLEIVNLSLQL